jgi:hypothetical protein
MSKQLQFKLVLLGMHQPLSILSKLVLTLNSGESAVGKSRFVLCVSALRRSY